MGHSMIVLCVGAGPVRGVHFASYYVILDLHLLWMGGASVISSARCLVSSLDNRPLSCNMLQLTSAVSPAIQRIFTPGYLSLSKLAIANRGKCGQ